MFRSSHENSLYMDCLSAKDIPTLIQSYMIIERRGKMQWVGLKTIALREKSTINMTNGTI